MKKSLHILVGKCAGNDFRIMLGDEDITDVLMVKQVRIGIGPQDLTTVSLELYADQIDIDLGTGDTKKP